MAGKTTETAEEAGLLPTIITGDPEVAQWAARRGLVAIEETNAGLNGAAQDGVYWAEAGGHQWIVLHGDLPLVASEELEELAKSVAARIPVLAPSSDGGTSAISSPDPVKFSYGPGSFHRHVAALDRPRIVARIGLLHDLDSSDDLASALSHPRGRWIEGVAGGVGR